MAKTGFDCPKCGAGILECSQGKCIQCGYAIGASESYSLALTAALKPIQEESNKRMERACNEVLASVDGIVDASKKFATHVIKIHEESQENLARNIRTSLRDKLDHPTLWEVIRKKFSTVFGSR